jgi:hypothetical protein
MPLHFPGILPLYCQASPMEKLFRDSGTIDFSVRFWRFEQDVISSGNVGLWAWKKPIAHANAYVCIIY